jgi:hypothetical protein
MKATRALLMFLGFMLLGEAATLSVTAREDRRNELNVQVKQLYPQGKDILSDYDISPIKHSSSGNAGLILRRMCLVCFF